MLPDGDGGLLIADSGNHVIRYVDAGGTITTIAGTGEAGYDGDGGPAIEARFDSPQSLYLFGDGAVLVNDEHNHAIRRIDVNGVVTTLAGTGIAGVARDGLAGPEAPLNDPENVVVLEDGSILITDGDNGYVWQLSDGAGMRRFAGRGSGR